jgi:hypothetical protein
MPNRVGIIVEGSDDKAVLEHILRRLGVQAKIRVARGSGNLKRKASSYCKILRCSGCDKIVIIRDLNCMDYDSVAREFSACLAADTRLCIPIHELESWLLADQNTLSNLLRSQISQISTPENIHDAKSKIKEIFERSGRTYIPSRDLPQIAERLDLGAVRTKCRSFASFEYSINDC